MARTTGDETRERLLDCARTAFLRDGFERSSLREICKEAGVTTGAFYRHFADKQELFAALVRPAAEAFLASYSQACDQSFDGLATNAPEPTREANLVCDLAFTRLTYECPDAFELLFERASGTPYEHFVDDLIGRELEFTHRQYDELEARGVQVRRISDGQMGMLVRAHMACLAEPAMRGVPLEEALASAEAISEFFWAGWQHTAWGR